MMNGFHQARRGLLAGLALAATLFAGASPARANLTEQQTFDAIALETYYYLYPLVVMDYTRRQLSNVPLGTGGLGAPTNTFGATRGFPTPAMHSVPRPNFDTLYSPAWIDMTAGPVLMTTPDTGDRYYVVTALDMWSEVFASVGTRTTGNRAGHFLFTPPGWTGPMPADLPAGTIPIPAPTVRVWIIGRTQTNGPDDFTAVHALQDQFMLTPYDRTGQVLAVPAFVPDATVDMKTPPNLQVEALPAAEFFAQAAELMKQHPPHLVDWPMVQRMSRIGIVAGQSYDADAQSAAVQAALDAAPATALAMLAWKFPHIAALVNQWSISTQGVGTYGTGYFQRAVIAKFGLGSNVPEDSVYPLSFMDADGKAFDGTNAYVLTFAAADIPPVEAFWSLALYDDDGFPVANELNRYAVSSWMPLAYNADGSLSIYIQSDTPGADKQANWLPAPKAGFGLNMRLYAPLADVTSGKWQPPAVQKATR
jgi:hypothetical protein